MAVHAQGLGALVQVEAGLGESRRRRHGRVTLQVVKLRGEGFDGVTERLNAGVVLRLAFGGAPVHLTQDAMGAIDREQTDRGAAEDQATQDAQGKQKDVHRTLRSRSDRLMIS